jgi:excisionase family DNA binding protein
MHNADLDTPDLQRRPHPLLLRPVDVAELCQVSTKTVLRAIRAGRLHACRLGTRGAYRIRQEDLEAWLRGSALGEDRRRKERGRLAVDGKVTRA